MVSDDKTPDETGGNGTVPAGDPTASQPQASNPVEPTQQQAYPEHDPNAAAQNPYGTEAQAASAYTQGAYTQGAAPQNAYTQGAGAPDAAQPTGQNPYAAPAAPAPDAYTQAATGAQDPYSQGAQNPYTQSADAQNAAYTQGAQPAYSQGAYAGATAAGATPAGAPTPGYPPTGGFGGGGVPPVPQPKPSDPAKKRKIILFSSIAAGLVLLLIIGAVVINVVNSNSYGPEAIVKSYLSALSKGKAEEAEKLVENGAGKGKDALFSDKVFSESKEFIKDPKVTRVTKSGDSAYVEISYKLDGTVFDGALELSKDGKQAIFFDNWKIDKPLTGTLFVSTNQSGNTTVGVNGQDVDFGDEYSLDAYPAVYTIGAPEGNPFFSADEQNAVVATGSKASFDGIQLKLAPTAELTKEVQSQINALIDTCVADTAEETDDACNLNPPTYAFGTVTTVTRTLGSYPTVEVDESGRSFDTTGGKVDLVVDGTDYSGAPKTESYYTLDSWSLYGDITIDGDKVTIEFY